MYRHHGVIIYMGQNIGILAIQGSIIEHEKILQKLHVDYSLVRSKEQLQNLTHIIIPGGESTTMTKLLKDFDMWDVLNEKISVPSGKNKKLKVFGTCAGAILLSKFGMDIKVERNGYGAQLDSFSADLVSKQFPNLKGIFIRAPRFTSHGSDVKVLVTHDNEPVLLEQENMLASSFHPELAHETRIHEWFLK